MNPPLVSVVLPFYKNPLVVEAVRSILGQSFRDLEVIAVDDCSPNGVADLLKQFDDPRLKVVIRETNGGAGMARNTGVALAQGRYIAFQDSDDVSYPERIARQIEALERDPSLVGCGTACIYGDQVEPHRLPDDARTLRWEMIFNSHVIFPTVVVRREVALANPFPGIPASEDYLWLHGVMASGDFLNLPDVLFHYRMQAGSLSRVQEEAQIKHGNHCRALFAKDLGIECSPEETVLLEWLGWPRHEPWPRSKDLRAAADLLAKLVEAFLARHPGDPDPVVRSALSRLRYATTISAHLGPSAYFAWRSLAARLPGKHPRSPTLLAKCVVRGLAGIGPGRRA